LIGGVSVPARTWPILARIQALSLVELRHSEMDFQQKRDFGWKLAKSGEVNSERQRL
jgi:hypothetical protein